MAHYRASKTVYQPVGTSQEKAAGAEGTEKIKSKSRGY
jgi:hypothetical protein